MMAPRAKTPPAAPVAPQAPSAWETRVEDLVPAEVLAELRAQVASRSRVHAKTGRRPQAPPRMWVHRPSDDPTRTATVTVELGDAQTEAIEALQAAMAALGVSGEVSGVLTTLTLACGTLATPPATDGSTTTEGPAASTTTTSGSPSPSAQGTATQGDGLPEVLARAKDLLGVVETISTVSNQLDGVLVSAVRDLAAARGQLLLGEKGVADPDELTCAQRDKWTKAAKSATRHELEAALGWYTSEIRDLVALAASPAATLAPVLHSLATGESSWQTARRFYRTAGPLPHEDTAAIANGLFGNDPEASVTDRLDSDGEFIGGPWRAGEFNRALDREVAKYTAKDEEGKQAARDRARANQDLRVRMDDDGTAEITIGCTRLQAATIADRVGAAAKAARQAGAPELIRELRSKTGITLLMHGTLDTLSLPDDPDLITVEASAELTKVLNGLPAAEIHVIVPYDTLIGHRTNPAVTDDTTAVPCTCTCECPTCTHPTDTTTAHSADAPDSDPGDPPEDRAGSAFFPPGGPAPAPGTASPDQQAQPGVGEVIGRHGMFLMSEEVQLLALLPGSTLHRLLIDPATGRCVERSINAYPFDAAMRAQIIASDLFCRAPGCLRPARLSQMDHVQEYGTPGGHTCEANGQPACEPHHDQKTKKAWDAVLHTNRDVTWTTLLGRIYRTKAHDYTQYTKLLTAVTTHIRDAITNGADPTRVVDDAIYQALSYRPPGHPLDVDDTEDLFHGWDTITLTHTRETGRRTYKPDPDIRQAEIDRHHSTDDQTTNDTTTDGQTTTDPAGAHTTADDPDGTTDRDTRTNPQTPWTDPNDEPPPF